MPEDTEVQTTLTYEELREGLIAARDVGAVLLEELVKLYVAPIFLVKACVEFVAEMLADPPDDQAEEIANSR